MFNTLPVTGEAVMDWSWSQFEPYYADLLQRDLTADSAAAWLADWTRIGELLDELSNRLYVATTQNTADKTAEAAYTRFLEDIQPAYTMAEQKLKEKLLASGLEPAGFVIPLRQMRAEASIFREANVPLLVEVEKLGMEYDRIAGSQSVSWQDEELTLARAYNQLGSLGDPERETLWRRIAERHLQDRDALNALWRQLLTLRQQIAANAGFASFREYQWKNFGRFDYTPADCERFHEAIEAVVVPAATRVYARHARQLGRPALRPWDLQRDHVYPPSPRALRPFQTVNELIQTAEAIFQRVDPALGAHFSTMRRENLLDLENRANKAPGGYCTQFLVTKRPFIFMNAVGAHDDVVTLLHEAGHAFHVFESGQLPYRQQKDYPIEFAEVASMSMELLSAPYWAASAGGYYAGPDLAQARRQHLEHILLFWPFMAVVDAFQQWVYTHVDDALDPAQCDAQWRQLWQRFIPGIDWTGFEAMQATGWHRKLHIFHIPFYYVDYGLAQLGAVQVWRNAQTDQPLAIQNYRRALALGGTATLPELFATAGARFAFDVETVRDAVNLIEATLAELDE
jgi:oligoendopeptidase F